MSLMPMYRPELVLLQELLPHSSWTSAQKRPSTPINLTIQRLSPSRIPLQIFIRFRQWLWSFKLLEPFSSSDEDEWGGHSSNHYTIGLVSGCPTVTVHAGKRFKALIDSGTPLTLVYSSIYNMIEDHYKTKILTAAVHLKTADGSSMSSLGNVK